ncbi:MAG: O-antigen ligase family protein, partial [Thermoleophilaceae bacterium]
IAVLLWESNLGWQVFHADGLNLALTLVWVLGIVNAFNFMDNMDGAAATVGALAAAAVAGLALVHGDPALAVVCGGLAGACAGFLPYNLAGPARIFLGDGGSLPIGFVVASSLMALSASKGLGWPLLLAAILLVGLPVADTALVLISRRRARVPLLSGGSDHLTHRLLTRLGSPRRVALALAAVQTLLGAVAIGVVELGDGSVLAAWCVWFAASATAVAMLETRSWAPVRGEEPEPARRTQRAPRAPRGGSLAIVEGGLVLGLTAACGLSPLFFGFYDESVWGPIALGLLAALLGMALARPVAPRRTAVVAVLGLVLLWLWALASTGWAESADLALTDANRWLLYAAVLAILVMLLRTDGLAKLLLAAATVAVCGLAAYIAVVLAFGDGPGLFLGGRLNEPLGYVNGQAGYLLLGFWPLIALAERPRSPAVAGAALAGATFLAGLVLLAETRAVIPAIVVTALVLVLAVPGRPARLWAILFVGAGLAVAAGPIVDVYRNAHGGQVAESVLHTAVLTLAVASLAAGSAWGAMRLLLGERARDGGAGLARLSAAAAVAVLLAGGVIAVAALGNPVTKVKREYRAFVHLRPSSQSSTRLTSGAGNRYDYWRIAVHQFQHHALRGEGAGNYKRTYFLERRTTEDVRQPHSVELETLAELGLVGGVALLLFVGAVLVGFARRARAARGSGTDLLLCVGAGGIFLTWLVHTSVDWLHLIPGVTGIALFGAAILIGPWRSGAPPARSRGRAVAIGVCALLVVFGAVLVGRAALADHYRSQAEDEVRSNPVKAIDRANDSLALNDEALPTYYAKAAAEARLNRYHAARAVLREAARREPHDFVTWGLLGDLAVRRGDRATARRDYARAHRLNPRDPTLRQLARHPLAGRG